MLQEARGGPSSASCLFAAVEEKKSKRKLTQSRVLQKSKGRRAGAGWGTERVVMMNKVLGTELGALGKAGKHCTAEQ